MGIERVGVAVTMCGMGEGVTVMVGVGVRVVGGVAVEVGGGVAVQENKNIRNKAKTSGFFKITSWVLKF